MREKEIGQCQNKILLYDGKTKVSPEKPSDQTKCETKEMAIYRLANNNGKNVFIRILVR